MKAYQTKSRKLPGTSYKEVYKKAFELYKGIKRKSKRRPYVRAIYFEKEKVFLGLFWQHLYSKLNLKDKTRRVKYFQCAIELLQNTRFDPISKKDPNSKSDILHRFAGITPDSEIFFVQIKEDKKTNQKYLISVFPFGKK